MSLAVGSRWDRRGFGVLVTLGAVIAVLASTGTAWGAAGDLDPTFSGDGVVVTPAAGAGSAMALDSKGRMVVVNGTTLERFLPNGTLDKSFGSGGVATDPITVNGSPSYARSVAVDSHDRIVVASAGSLSDPGFTVGRLTVSGSPDPSFSGDGQTLTKIGGYAEAWAVGVDPQGRIVAAGSSFTKGKGGSVALARYLPNGTPDRSFSGDGKQHSQFPDEANAYARALAFDSKGRIVVAGTVVSPDEFVLARYTPTGELDTTFSGDGMLTTKIGPDGPWGDVGLAIDASDRIVFAGDDEPSDESSSELAIARLRVNGAFDPSFSGDGKVLTSFGQRYSRANGVAIDHEGRIVAVGSAGPSFAIARYTPAGQLDPSFSGDGEVTTSIAPVSTAEHVAVDASDRIVVSGELRSRDPRHPNSRIALARYLGQ